jgi:hypothetical protein
VPIDRLMKHADTGEPFGVPLAAGTVQPPDFTGFEREEMRETRSNSLLPGSKR